MRKPIQVTTGPDDTIYVLCDDGTIWFIAWVNNGWTEWRQVPEMPKGAK